MNVSLSNRGHKMKGSHHVLTISIATLARAVVKMKFTTLHTLLLSLLMTSLAQATLIIDTTAPSANVQISQTTSNNNSGFDAGDFTQMGQTFTTGGTGFDLAEIAMIKGGNQNYTAGNTILLHLFSWNPSDDANNMSNGGSPGWSDGDGSGDLDPINGTGMTQISGEIFSLPSGLASAGDILHFQLATPVALTANTAYGFTFQFIYGAGAGPDSMSLKQASSGSPYADGRRIKTTATVNGNAGGADLAFYAVAATAAAVPEPSSFAMMLIAVAPLLFRRRRL